MGKLVLGLLVCVSLFGSFFGDAKNACDAGNAIGCSALGFMYQYGEGVKQNDFKAVKFYKKAWDSGNAKGCYGFGFMYELREGVKQDSQKALELYGKACDLQFEGGCKNYALLKKELGQ